MMTRQNLWSDEDTAKARELVAQAATNQQFLQAINRTKAAAYSRIQWIDNPKFRDEAATRARRSRNNNQFKNEEIRSHPTRTRDIPDHVIADAAKRAEAPRTITAWVAGDPAPHESALAKKLAEATS